MRKGLPSNCRKVTFKLLKSQFRVSLNQRCLALTFHRSLLSISVADGYKIVARRPRLANGVVTDIGSQRIPVLHLVKQSLLAKGHANVNPKLKKGEPTRQFDF